VRACRGVRVWPVTREQRGRNTTANETVHGRSGVLSGDRGRDALCGSAGPPERAFGMCCSVASRVTERTLGDLATTCRVWKLIAGAHSKPVIGRQRELARTRDSPFESVYHFQAARWSPTASSQSSRAQSSPRAATTQRTRKKGSPPCSTNLRQRTLLERRLRRRSRAPRIWPTRRPRAIAQQRAGSPYGVGHNPR